MNPSRLRGRYFRILTFFIGVISRVVWWELVIARFGMRKLTRRTRPDRFRSEAVRFRALAIRMGGVMIKVGQFLSSRLDVLPPEITDTLADLQDEVPAEMFGDIRQLAEKELKASLEDQFEWFDENPLAAASLGQVHRARLKVPDEAQDFRDVVVKVQRPSIEHIVEVDLSALQRVGKWLMHYRPVREHADVPALLREFSDTVREEIDYILEAENATTFYENFKEDRVVHIPRVVQSRTTRRVLTLEDVYAIKITDYAAVTAAGIDRREVARELLDTYLEQIFEDGFFHADPHPGNLFVTPFPYKRGRTKNKPTRWQLTFVDFGMVGRVPADLKAGLRQLVIAVGTRDPDGLIKAYQALGFLLPGINYDALVEASTAVFDRFWGLSMSDIRSVRPEEFRNIGHRVRDLMVDMPFQVPNNLLMLVRTVAILSGMCTGLDPNFNLWEQLSPYARKLVADEATSGLDAILDQLGDVLKVLIAIPSQTTRVLALAERGGLVVQAPQVSRDVRSLGRSIDRLTAGLILVAFLLGGVLLYNAGNPAPGIGFVLLSLIVLIWILISGGRTK